MSLIYLVPSAYTIAFRLPGPLTRGPFGGIVDALAAASTPIDDTRSTDEHWSELQKRAAGRSRWDTVAPWPPPQRPTKGLVTSEYLSGRARSMQTVQNILTHRPYRRFQLGDYLATVDLLNPADELELGYVDARDCVVCLLFSGPRLIQDNLTLMPGIYDLLLRFDEILRPSAVVGSASMATPLLGYADGSIDRSISPWSFLYPLSVINRQSSFPPDADLAQSFAVVKAWPRDRLLLQALPGLSLDVVPKFSACAKLVGRVAVQETL